MINFVTITRAVKDILDAANTTDANYVIERNSVINTDESRAFQGWIGIYRDSVSYEPYTTGNQPFMAELKIRIEVQAASQADAEDCESKLDALVDFIMAAIDADRNLSGNVAMIRGYDIDYDDNFAETTDIFFQTATIIATYEVRA